MELSSISLGDGKKEAGGRIVGTGFCQDEADYFGIYCVDNDRAYLVLVDEVGKAKCKLRLLSVKNADKKVVI